MPFNCIKTETRGRVGLITLDRPKALNAINAELVGELATALDGFESDDGVGAMVLTGSEKAFAAGADIKEMLAKEFVDVVRHDFIQPWECLSRCRKPIVAAVSGYALGGGCEIAMMCDIVLAADTARFGQPEILLGTFPGAGGTQRLPRAVGKAKAMELVLAGRMGDAEEAERAGLVSRVVAAAEFLDEAMKVAAKIAEQSLPSVMMAKESVDRAYQLTLDEGIRFERRLFQSTFATEDRRQGMRAFADKRKPAFKNRLPWAERALGTRRSHVIPGESHGASRVREETHPNQRPPPEDQPQPDEPRPHVRAEGRGGPRGRQPRDRARGAARRRAGNAAGREQGRAAAGHRVAQGVPPERPRAGARLNGRR